MNEELREEFQILNGYSEELKKALTAKLPMYVYQLLKIADHITLCDHLAKKTESEKAILYTSSHYWGKCAERWIKYKIDQKNTSRSLLKKTWEEVITKDDKRFLRELRITVGISSPNNNEDDKA